MTSYRQAAQAFKRGRRGSADGNPGGGGGGVDAGQSTCTATTPVNTGVPSTVTVTAKGSGGSPLAGQTVTFSVSGTNNTLHQPTATTDASGVATGTFGQGLQLVADGTAQAGAATTITLAAGSSATDNFYKGDDVYIYSGTGAGQPPNIVASYVGSTKVATMQNTWTVTPDATSKYVIIPSPFVADVWDEARSAHNTAGTFGEGVASVQGNLTGTTGAAASVTGNVGGNVVGSVASVTSGVTVTTNNDKTGYTASTVSDKTGYSLTTSPGIVKNTALAKFPFVMTDATTHAPKTGLTVTATRSLDGGVFAACTNAVVELASGVYLIDLAAADLNGTTVVLLFTATGADALPITIKTQA